MDRREATALHVGENEEKYKNNLYDTFYIIFMRF